MVPEGDFQENVTEESNGEAPILSRVGMQAIDIPSKDIVQSALPSPRPLSTGCGDIPSAPGIIDDFRVSEWQGKADKVLDCQRNGSAERYKKLLQDYETVAKEIDRRIDEKVEENKLKFQNLETSANQKENSINALQEFVESMSKGNRVLENKKSLIEEYTKIQERFHQAITEKNETFEEILTNFIEMKKEYSVVFNEINELVAVASQSDVPELADIQTRLFDLESDYSVLPNQILLDAKRFRGELLGEKSKFDREIGELRDTAASMGLDWDEIAEEYGIKSYTEVLELVTSTSRMVHTCDDYLEKLHQRVKRISEQLTQRKNALIVQQVSAAEKKRIKEASLLQASTRFLDQVNEKIEILWEPAVKSEFYNISYLEEAYKRVLGFLQMAVMCEDTNTIVTWMETGCVAVNNEKAKAERYLQRTIPFLLRLNAKVLRNAGADETLVTTVEAGSTGGDVAMAVSNNDILLQLLDNQAATGE